MLRNRRVRDPSVIPLHLLAELSLLGLRGHKVAALAQHPGREIVVWRLEDVLVRGASVGSTLLLDCLLEADGDLARALVVVCVHLLKELTSKEHVGGVLEVVRNLSFFKHLFGLLVFHEDLMALINQLLLPLNVLEHELALGHANVVREHLRVVLVELEDSGQAVLRLFISVEPL